LLKAWQAGSFAAAGNVGTAAIDTAEISQSVRTSIIH
jgi:hypothetical protein